MSERAELAAEAYIYYYPLVENLKQVQRYVEHGIGSNPAAPFNAFSHARKLAGPEDTFVTINNDTVYSMAQLDLSAGPLRLEVPDTGERYYVLQFVDAWTNNIAYVGTRATGNRAGRFVLLPPGHHGPVPDGHTPIQSSTAVLSIVGRFACSGPDDIPGVTAVQDAVVLEPLDPGSPDPAGVPAPAAGAPDELAFWEQARAWSEAFPPPDQESELVARFAELGVNGDAGQYVDAEPSLREALTAGAKAGDAKIEEVSHHGRSPVINGWTVGVHAFDYNVYTLGVGTRDEDGWKIHDETGRIIERAITCRLGLWGNHGYEAVYAQAFTDIGGQPLHGHASYTIAFSPLPPVDAFWSITMYDIPRYYLVANPLYRYSIGDRTAGIRYGDDGGVTITVGHDEPTDPVARANWLPAPDDRFRLVLRLYIPGEPILDGSYQFPRIQAA